MTSTRDLVAELIVEQLRSCGAWVSTEGDTDMIEVDGVVCPLDIVDAIEKEYCLWRRHHAW